MYIEVELLSRLASIENSNNDSCFALFAVVYTVVFSCIEEWR